MLPRETGHVLGCVWPSQETHYVYLPRGDENLLSCGLHLVREANQGSE